MNARRHPVSKLVGIALLALMLLIGTTAAQARVPRKSPPKPPPPPAYEWVPARNGEPAAWLRVAPELVAGRERASAARLTWNPARGELTLEDRRGL